MDGFDGMARQMIEQWLLNHPDEGVRAITALCGVPDEAVARVAAKLRAQAAKLAAMPDEDIDA